MKRTRQRKNPIGRAFECAAYLYYWFSVGEATLPLHHLIAQNTLTRLGILPLSHRQVISLLVKKIAFAKNFCIAPDLGFLST
jgi:hypothetical protein